MSIKVYIILSIEWLVRLSLEFKYLFINEGEKVENIREI